MIKDVTKSRVKIIFNSKFISVFIVLFILGALLVSGPAGAFLIGIKASDKIVEKGKQVSFNITIDTQEGEKPKDIDYLTFRLKGPSVFPIEYNCKFYLNGTKEDNDGCKGINVNLISIDPLYGYNNDCSLYGYGYNNGYGYDSRCKLSYIITLDTTNYEAGEYENSFIIVSKENEFKQDGENIKIILPPDNNITMKRCSIRAFDGSLGLINKNFTNNKLSFFITINKNNGEVKGQGSLTGQKNRDRFSYRFKIIDILENDNSHAIILVSGKYKVGKGEKIDENALLYFDKILNRISVRGEQINIKTMIINFREDC